MHRRYPRFPGEFTVWTLILLFLIIVWLRLLLNCWDLWEESRDSFWLFVARMSSWGEGERILLVCFLIWCYWIPKCCWGCCGLSLQEMVVLFWSNTAILELVKLALPLCLYTISCNWSRAIVLFNQKNYTAVDTVSSWLPEYYCHFIFVVVWWHW